MSHRIDVLQVEINEAELDGILANVKRGKEPPARVGRIQARNALHKKHTERLEQVLRALDNEAISVQQVDGLKEAIEDYLVCSENRLACCEYCCIQHNNEPEWSCSCHQQVTSGSALEIFVHSPVF